MEERPDITNTGDPVLDRGVHDGLLASILTEPTSSFQSKCEVEAIGNDGQRLSQLSKVTIGPIANGESRKNDEKLTFISGIDNVDSSALDASNALAGEGTTPTKGHINEAQDFIKSMESPGLSEDDSGIVGDPKIVGVSSTRSSVGVSTSTVLTDDLAPDPVVIPLTQPPATMVVLSDELPPD